MRTAALASLIPLLAAVACTSSSGNGTVSGASADAAVVDGNGVAIDSALGASESAMGPMFGAPGMGGPGGPGGCQPAVTVVSTASVCGHDLPAQVHLEFSCTFPNGDSVTGSDDVATTITPDACPATSLAVQHALTLDESRVRGQVSSHVQGTSTVNFDMAPPPPMPTGMPTPGSMPPMPPPPAHRAVAFDLTLQATNGGNPWHDATVSGTRTVELNTNGTLAMADDTLLIDGQALIQDIVQDAKVELTDAGLTRTHDCCYPIAGTSTLVRSVLDDPSVPAVTHSITFGPSCGQASREDGTAVPLPSCPMHP